jgi:hypothetical protein
MGKNKSISNISIQAAPTNLIPSISSLAAPVIRRLWPKMSLHGAIRTSGGIRTSEYIAECKFGTAIRYINKYVRNGSFRLATLSENFVEDDEGKAKNRTISVTIAALRKDCDPTAEPLDTISLDVVCDNDYDSRRKILRMASAFGDGRFVVKQERFGRIRMAIMSKDGFGDDSSIVMIRSGGGYSVYYGVFKAASIGSVVNKYVYDSLDDIDQLLSEGNYLRSWDLAFTFDSANEAIEASTGSTGWIPEDRKQSLILDLNI